MMDVQWALISTVTASLAHFVLRIVLGKELGAEGLGVYTLAFAIYFFGMQFAAFGIGSALTKYVAEFLEDQDKIKKYVSSGMSSSIITGTIMGIVLFILAPFIALSFFHIPELEILIQLVALCYPFIAIQKAVIGTLNGFRRMHLYAFLNIVQNVGVVAVSLGLVLGFKMGIFGAVIGFVGSTIIISLFSPVLIRDSLSLEQSSLWFLPALRATTVFGFYVVLTNSISYFNTQVDSILIGFYLNPTEVGIYAVAILLSQIITLIPSAVQRVTAPATATLYGKGDLAGVREIIISTMKKSFFVSIVTAVFIAIIGQFLITFFFTVEFLPAYLPLLILLLGNIIFAPIMSVGATLSSIGKVHISFRVDAVCGVINVILNILLIPHFGIIGAALATTVSTITSFGIYLALIHKYCLSTANSIPLRQ